MLSQNLSCFQEGKNILRTPACHPSLPQKWEWGSDIEHHRDDDDAKWRHMAALEFASLTRDLPPPPHPFIKKTLPKLTWQKKKISSRENTRRAACCVDGTLAPPTGMSGSISCFGEEAKINLTPFLSRFFFFFFFLSLVFFPQNFYSFFS